MLRFQLLFAAFPQLFMSEYADAIAESKLQYELPFSTDEIDRNVDVKIGELIRLHIANVKSTILFGGNSHG